MDLFSRAVPPVVAGRLIVHATATLSVGEFVYGKSYLLRSDAICLDLARLPLGDRPFNSPHQRLSRRDHGRAPRSMGNAGNRPP